MALNIATSVVDAKAILRRAIVSAAQEAELPIDHISWPNAPGKKPEDDYWLDVLILFGESRIRTFGRGGDEGQNSRNGTLFLNFYGPKNVGTGKLDRMIGVFAAAFERQELESEIFCHRVLGPVPLVERNWDTGQLVVRFRFWETVS